MPLIQVVAMLVLASSRFESSDTRTVAPVFSLGAGYAIPIGSLFKSETVNINNAMKGGVPLTLEAGVALWSSWHVVAYAGYAFLDRSERCPPTSDCSGAQLRFGGQVQWWGDPYGGWRALVGLGGGWEKIRLDSQEGSLSFSGFEGVLTIGAIYGLGSFGIGPYIEATLGAYSSVGGETIQNQAMHGWVVIGVRVDYSP